MGYLLKNFNPLWFKRAGRCDSPYYWRRVGVLEISRVGLLALCSTRVRPAEMRYTRPCYPRLGELLLQYLIYVQYRFDWLHGNELCITGGISAAARLCRNAPLAHYCVGVTSRLFPRARARIYCVCVRAWTFRHTPQNFFQGQNIHSNIHSNGCSQECNYSPALALCEPCHVFNATR